MPSPISNGARGVIWHRYMVRMALRGVSPFLEESAEKSWVPSKLDHAARNREVSISSHLGPQRCIRRPTTKGFRTGSVWMSYVYSLLVAQYRALKSIGTRYARCTRILGGRSALMPFIMIVPS